jgi:hypothetical protein
MLKKLGHFNLCLARASWTESVLLFDFYIQNRRSRALTDLTRDLCLTQFLLDSFLNLSVLLIELAPKHLHVARAIEREMLAMYLRNERKCWISRIASLNFYHESN